MTTTATIEPGRATKTHRVTLVDGPGTIDVWLARTMAGQLRTELCMVPGGAEKRIAGEVSDLETVVRDWLREAYGADADGAELRIETL